MSNPQDGAAWRIKAMQAVSAYLSEKLTGSLAGAGVRIIT